MYKKGAIIITLFLLIQHLVFSQEFTKSNTYYLTKYNTPAVEKATALIDDSNEFITLILTDNNRNNLKQIQVLLETYTNDASVEELITTSFLNVKKIIRVIINQCACYCDTTKYYWFVTNNDLLIDLPPIFEADYELKLQTLDYVFNTKSNTIHLIEYQDESIKEIENDELRFRLKSKTTLKTYLWNGHQATED